MRAAARSERSVRKRGTLGGGRRERVRSLSDWPVEDLAVSDLSGHVTEPGKDGKLAASRGVRHSGGRHEKSSAPS